VLVVGGGVIGCAIARELAGPGRSVLLVDRGAIGGEASSAAAGVLVEAGEDDGARLALRRASRAMFPALAAALAEETGIDVEFAVEGLLELALDEADGAAQTTRVAARRSRGIRVEVLDGSGVRELEPHANPAVQGGLLFPDEACVNAERLVGALARSAERRGAVLLAGHAVRGARHHGERLTEVAVGDQTITPGVVVLAAGAWSARIPGLARRLDIVPARGQMLALRAGAPCGRRVLSHGDGYLVPRASGELLLGATVEDAGFERAVTPAGLQTLLGHLHRIAPALLDACITRTWSGLRPATPAGGPLIGRDPDTSNLFIATGHYRNGILLAPITAEVVRAVIDGTAPPLDPAPFSPENGPPLRR